MIVVRYRNQRSRGASNNGDTRWSGMAALAHIESTALAVREPAVTDLGPLGRALAWSRRPGAWLLFRLPRPLLALIGRKRLVAVEGRTIDVQIAAMLAIDDLFQESDLRRLSPAAARRRIQVSIAALELPRRRELRTTDGRLAGPACWLPYRLYVPPGIATPSPLVLYIHGGGWVTGCVATHDALCRYIAAAARVRVLSLAYRLAPESPFPAAADDVLAAFRAVAERDRAEALGVDTTRIAVMGDSAGGNLSAVVSLRTRNDAVRPALQVLLYPALDATLDQPSHLTHAEGWFLTRPMIEWYYGHYLSAAVDRDGSANAGGIDRRSPDVSPLFADDAVIKSLPRALVYTAGFDPLLDEGRKYAERLAAAGVASQHRCFETLPHGFATMAGAVFAARAAVDEIASDIAVALGTTTK